MSNERFEIFFKRDFDQTLYRAEVEIIYRSEKMLRFAVRAGEKELLMEKWLFRKTHQWKIKKTNFNLAGHTKVNARMIMVIQDEIDAVYKKLYPGQ